MFSGQRFASFLVFLRLFYSLSNFWRPIQPRIRLGVCQRKILRENSDYPYRQSEYSRLRLSLKNSLKKLSGCLAVSPESVQLNPRLLVGYWKVWFNGKPLFNSAEQVKLFHALWLHCSSKCTILWLNRCLRVYFYLYAPKFLQVLFTKYFLASNFN